MAVESTPERSFSLLFRSSRAAWATTGWTPRSAQMRRGHHGSERALDRPGRIGEEGRHAGQRLVRLRVEDVQDGADQERMAGLFPVVPALERPFGVDQHIGDVLDVAHLPRRRAAPRAAGCRRRSAAFVGSNSRQCENRARQPAVSCQFSPLMSWTMTLSVQESRVGTTRPTPLPLRVGAKASTCSGPSWRRTCLSHRPRRMPAGSNSPAARMSRKLAQRAEP